MTPRRCCTGECDQGRACPARMPAEACTEIGADVDLPGPVVRFVLRHAHLAPAAIMLALAALVAASGGMW